RGVARVLPLSVLAFALGGVALIGLPPGGAWLAKEQLLRAAAGTGQWWGAVAVQAGGGFTSSYVVLVPAHALASPQPPVHVPARVPHGPQAAALALALGSLSLGLVPWGGYLPEVRATLPDPLAPDTIWKALWPVLAGAALAILLGRWGHRLLRALAGDAL